MEKKLRQSNPRAGGNVEELGVFPAWAPSEETAGGRKSHNPFGPYGVRNVGKGSCLLGRNWKEWFYQG